MPKAKVSPLRESTKLKFNHDDLLLNDLIFTGLEVHLSRSTGNRTEQSITIGVEVNLV